MARITPLIEIGRNGSPPWTIDGVLSGLTLMWGDAGVGKSFLAMSMAASVATGRPWMGRHTSHGQVVYVAGEGGLTNVGHRLRTAVAEWRIEDRDDYLREGVDIAVVTPGVDLVANGDHLQTLLKGYTNMKLLVIDTLSRCLLGNENQQEPMGRFVHTLDEVRDMHGCDILVIHHANKEDKIRGSSVLFGAADVSWKLTKTGTPGVSTHLLKSDKLRERDSTNGEMRILLESVPIHGWDGSIVMDELGDVQTTLVARPQTGQLDSVKMVADVGKAVLAAEGYLSYDLWYSQVTMPKIQFNNCLSYILSFPGKWGIKRGLAVGEYMRGA